MYNNTTKADLFVSIVALRLYYLWSASNIENNKLQITKFLIYSKINYLALQVFFKLFNKNIVCYHSKTQYPSNKEILGLYW